MEQMEYLILQIFPLGGSGVIAQFANSYMAIRFLEALVNGSMESAEPIIRLMQSNRLR